MSKRKAKSQEQSIGICREDNTIIINIIGDGSTATATLCRHTAYKMGMDLICRAFDISEDAEHDSCPKQGSAIKLIN